MSVDLSDFFSELVRVGDFQIVDLSDSRLKWACTVVPDEPFLQPVEALAFRCSYPGSSEITKVVDS